MHNITINGPNRLEGTVKISGAKNAILPIMAATVLARGGFVIRNAPNVSDVVSMANLLETLGAKTDFSDHTLHINTCGLDGNIADYKHVSAMRASVCLLGPLLARFGKTRVSMPGGCVIGPRPIDLHIKGLQSLGAKIDLDHGDVVAEAKRLRGSRMYLGGAFGSSVLATANVMMAASLAQGTTVITSAACEPEVVDLGNFLNQMGAAITGLGSPVLTIHGVKELRACEYSVIPDRIEAGTFMIAAAMTQGDVTLENMNYHHLGALFDKLSEAGITITERDGHMRVRARGKLRSVSATTHAYPGFPTDLQAQITALMCVTPGLSVITEKIYPERFMHISELNRMGANIRLEGPSAIVLGARSLSGAPVMASDLRASAALVLAGIAAHGQSEISRMYHLDRGYEGLVEKFQSLGAKITRETESTARITPAQI